MKTLGFGFLSGKSYFLFRKKDRSINEKTKNDVTRNFEAQRGMANRRSTRCTPDCLSAYWYMRRSQRDPRARCVQRERRPNYPHDLGENHFNKLRIPLNFLIFRLISKISLSSGDFVATECYKRGTPGGSEPFPVDTRTRGVPVDRVD